jgi:hypothetical protein
VSAGVNRRRLLVMADQGTSSLSNVVVAIIAARSLSADGFGAFAVATVGYLVATGFARAFIGETFLSTYSAAERHLRDAVASDLIGAALVLACVAGLVAGVAGLAVGGPAGSALVALAFVMPLLLVQDAWRYVFIVDQPERAVAVDLAWLVGVGAILPLAPNDVGPGWFVGGWGLAAGLGALAGLALAARTLSRPRPLRWLSTHRRMGWRFFSEMVTGQAVSQLVLVGLGAIAGLSTLGGVRAAQVFYGPLNTVHQGIYLALVPEGARTESPQQLRRLMARASLVVVSVAVGWMVVGLVLPDSVGTALFRDTWEEAGGLMLPVGLAVVAGSITTGGFAGVRSLGDATVSLRARLQTVVPQLVLPLSGAAIAAGTGFALGWGLANVASATIWWVAFGRALRSWRARRVRIEIMRAVMPPSLGDVTTMGAVA